jgi:hypothetical protein
MVLAGPRCPSSITVRGIEMGKYFLAWILGVPAVVLVGIYLLSHL